MKTYHFTVDEMVLIREALAEHKHHLTPGPEASDQRKLNYHTTSELHKQFANDVRKS